MIETKFELGQEVYILGAVGKEIATLCQECNGTQHSFTKSGIEVSCPCCFDGYIKTYTDKWTVDRKEKIGYIRAEVYLKHTKRHEDTIMYMFGSTGVGGGAMYYEKNLYATLEEAQAECDKRNKELGI